MISYYLWHLMYHLHLVSFHVTKCFSKNLVRGNAYWTNYWIWIEGVWAPCRTYIPKTGYFHDKTKSSKTNLRVHYLMLKRLQKAMYLISLTWTKSQNLTPKCKILNVFWTWPEVKGVIFSTGFQTSKILFFQMAPKTCEMWSELL